MKKIFLVGCPRSGTTLLQSMIAAHPDICSFTESHFFSKGFSFRKKPWFRLNERALVNYRNYRVNPQYSHYLASFLDDNQIDNVNADHLKQVYNNGHQHVSAADAVQLFAHTLSVFAKNQGNEGWLEKTPTHVRHVPFIEKHIPEAHFIHIGRECMATSASLYDMSKSFPESWKNKSLEDCAARWNADMKLTLRHQKKPNHLSVRYEELVSAPEHMLQVISSFIGVSWNESMLRYNEKTEKLVRADEQWKSNNFQGIKQSSRVDKLTLEEQQLVEKKCRRKLYERLPLWT